MKMVCFPDSSRWHINVLPLEPHESLNENINIISDNDNDAVDEDKKKS